jgi:mycothiol synthase
VIRPPRPGEDEVIQRVWEASALADDPGGRPRGGWSAMIWATHLRVAVVDDDLVGVAGVRFDASADAVPARVALLPERRSVDLSRKLVETAARLAAEAGGRRVRLFVGSEVAWARDAAVEQGFSRQRTIFHMLRPADAPPLESEAPEGLVIRSISAGEEGAVLRALNRNWDGTWAFQPIAAELLERDLQGQRGGMLLAVVDDAIVATVHAIFDPTEQNPDGAPRAWISNLTVDPAWRGKGLGRTMLARGLEHLQSQGARSVTLGVDAGNAAPVRLYRSTGFDVVSSLDVWDRDVSADAKVEG